MKELKRTHIAHFYFVSIKINIYHKRLFLLGDKEKVWNFIISQPALQFSFFYGGNLRFSFSFGVFLSLISVCSISYVFFRVCVYTHKTLICLSLFFLLLIQEYRQSLSESLVFKWELVSAIRSEQILLPAHVSLLCPISCLFSIKF